MGSSDLAGQKPRGYSQRWNIKEDAICVRTTSETCRRCKIEYDREMCCEPDGGCIMWQDMVLEFEKSRDDEERPCRFCSSPCDAARGKGWL